MRVFPLLLKQQYQIMLVKADEEEEDGSAQHPDCVEGSVAPVPAPELSHHRDQGHVEEHADCAGQEP